MHDGHGDVIDLVHGVDDRPADVAEVHAGSHVVRGLVLILRVLGLRHGELLRRLALEVQRDRNVP